MIRISNVSFSLCTTSLSTVESEGNEERIWILYCMHDLSNTWCCRKDDVPVHGPSEMIVGVLGGGQLGRMLCQAASKMAVKVMVLDPLENCPASALAYHHMVGSFDNSTTVREFAKRFDFIDFHDVYVNSCCFLSLIFLLLLGCNITMFLVDRCGVLTVEIEHVDVATLEMLEQQGVDCQPKASTIRIIQVSLSFVFKIWISSASLRKRP